MREMSGTSWRGRGSSIVFDKRLLGPLLATCPVVSLRQALAWVPAWPTQSPPTGSTIVVGGLETVLETLPPADAETFVRQRIRALINEFQQQWDQCGLVFGLLVAPQRFKVTVQGEVLFVTRTHDEIRLSATVWNGSASDDLFELIFKDPATGQQVRGGFHVPHRS